MRRILAMIMMLTLTATVGCVGERKPTKEKAEQLEKYIKDSAPKEIKKLGVNFDNKVTLLGYTISPEGPVARGKKVSYTLYWKSEKQLKSGWKLFTHVMADKKKRLLNIDEVGPLRGRRALRPSKWQVGKVYVDKQSFTIPKKAKGSSIKITTGIWKGNKRLKIIKGPQLGENRALVATVPLKGAKAKRNTRVPRLRVNKLTRGQTVKIDGKLDDKAWLGAAATGKFVSPKDGNPDEKSPVQGQAKVLWDNKAMYLGFTVEDADIIGGFKKSAKDPHLWTKDCVEIMIDPDGDGDNKDYYEIQVNPQNLVFDSRFDDYNKPKKGPDGPFGHQEWSAKIKSAVRVDGTLDKSGDKDKGYTVEIRLPWSSLKKAKAAPPKVGDQWRMNFYAMQNNGGVSWSAILGQGNFHKASRFGRVLWADKDYVDPAKKSLKSRPKLDGLKVLNPESVGNVSLDKNAKGKRVPKKGSPKP